MDILDCIGFSVVVVIGFAVVCHLISGFMNFLLGGDFWNNMTDY